MNGLIQVLKVEMEHSLFRTGISCIRIALRKIVMINENEDTVKLR